jgi:SPP1 gp7 family putative phage head morphogenesis protein
MLRVGSEYNTELQKLVLQIKKAVEAELLPVIEQEAPNYTADAWPERVQAVLDRLRLMFMMPGFNAMATAVAAKFVRSTLAFADRKNKSFGIEVFNGESTKLNNYLRAATIQNADLIKSIPAKYLNDVANTVQTNMRIGLRPSEIAKSLTEKYGIAQRHAKFIARDQAAKVNGEITKQRQLDAGFVAFRWLDADDSRVRHRHREIANADIGMGKGVYLWSDLPMGEEGVPIQPGSTYNCRCVSRPVRTSVINATIAQRKKQLQSA